MDTTAGGWKAGYVSWIAGTKYNTGTAQDVYDLLNDIKPVITGSGLWELDTTIHTGSAADAPLLMDNTDLKWTHGLFFVNKVSGSKLCITYTYRGSSFHVAKRTLSGQWTYDNYFGGMCLSVIPPNSGSFDPTQYAGRGFIPDKGVPIQSAFMVASQGGTNSLYSVLSLAKSKTDSGFCMFAFSMKDDVVGVFLRSTYIGSGVVARGAFYGHIFDDDAVPCPELESDLPASNYGMVHLIPCISDNELQNPSGSYGFNICQEYMPKRTETSGGGAGSVLRRTNVMKTMTDTEYYSVEDGCWIAQMPCGIGIPYQLYSNPQSPVGTSTHGVFSEIAITAGIADNTVQSSRYGKGSTNDAIMAAGVLRGDMVLAGKANIWTRGQTFGNKTYVYVGGGCVIGWDPSIGFGLFD